MKKILLATIVCTTIFTTQQIQAQTGKLDHECTSWIVFSDLTKNNTNILHKNRDAMSREVAVYLSKANSPRKWIAQGNNNFCAMAMNASGLAGIMNSGEKCINCYYDRNKANSSVVLQRIMESCDTAQQAVEFFRKIVKNSDYSRSYQKGSTFLFCDTCEGYVCEMTTKDISVVRYDKGYTVRANIWLNPGMQQLARNDLKNYLNSANRMYMAISLFNQVLDKNGQLTLPDIFTVSRHHKMPEDAADKRSLCFKYTNSTGSFEIDKQYPDVLSTAYFTIGHPLHTVYVPIPICVEKVHPAMSSTAWAAGTWKRFDKIGLQDIPADWVKFEKDFMAKYIAAKAEARKLLNSGKRAEAVKLINDTAETIWKDAVKLMDL